DAYFASRPRDSQLGAWASDQSQPLDDRQTFLDRLEETRQRFDGGDVPRPPHWSGFRVAARRIEFWQELPYRHHDRLVYHYRLG
ncbi:pyridoxine 5'-phosphate oxidase C-terminal domain-containing protein, partial [Halomonas sp. SIMBA_159]